MACVHAAAAGSGRRLLTSRLTPHASSAMAQRRIRLPPPPRLPPVFERDESHTLVDDFTVRAARHRARQQPTLPLVMPVPIRTHPIWTSNNSLGFELVIGNDATETDIFERTVLKLDEFGMPETWTLSVSTNFDARRNVNDNQAFFLAGLLEIGSGGVVDQIEFDWRNGSTFRLPMNALNLKVRGVFGDPAGGPGSIVPPNFAVRAILARSNQSGLPPQATVVANATNGALDPSNSAVAIPKYAKTFKPTATTAAAAAAMFAAGNFWEFWSTSGSGGTLIATIRAEDLVHYMSGGVPIPNPARFVGFNNNAAPAALQYRIVFDLSL